MDSKGCSPQQPDDACPSPSSDRETLVVGRYLVGKEIGAGGMATVHVGRLLGPGGFARTVAIKRLRAELARDRDFVEMFLDEARIAARVQHANVGQTVDVVTAPNEVILVMEYIHGDSLGGLRRAAASRDDLVPASVACSIALGVLRGLHAAHESRGEHGEAIGLVHRDVSPENVIVGVDGIAKVLDFGIVMAADRVHYTTTRLIKGKLGYMSPEQTLGEKVDRRSDIFSAGIVLWESLAGVRLFRVRDPRKTIEATRTQPVPRLSEIVPDVPPEVDDVLARALAKNPDDRFQTAEDMAEALEAALAPASPREVGEWVAEQAEDILAERSLAIAALHGNKPKERAGVVSKTKILAAASLTDAPSREVSAITQAEIVTPRPSTISTAIEPEAIYTADVEIEMSSAELVRVPSRALTIPPPPGGPQGTVMLNRPSVPTATSGILAIPPTPPSVPPPASSSRSSLMPTALPSAPYSISSFPSGPISTSVQAHAMPTPVYLVESRWSAAIRVVTMIALGASIMIVLLASFPGRLGGAAPAAAPPAPAPPPPAVVTPSPAPSPTTGATTTSAPAHSAPPKMRAPIPPRYLRMMQNRSNSQGLPANPYDRSQP